MSLIGKFGLKELFSKTGRSKSRADYRQSVADRSDEGVAVIDIDGTLQFVNGAWASMHGYANRDGLVGSNIKQFYAKKAGNDFNRYIAQTKLLGWYIATVEQLRKDGTTFAAQLKMAVLKGDSAKPNAILLVAADLSRVSQLQKMLERTNEELALVKTQVGRLEESINTKHHSCSCHNAEKPAAAQSPLPIPVTEMRQLAEMAKRFR